MKILINFSLVYFFSHIKFLIGLGEEISEVAVHTFTKISVGSQTDLQVLLAYVKGLQNQLESCNSTDVTGKI